MELNEVAGFEPNDEFSDAWDDVTLQPASFWGMDPNGYFHSLLHEREAQECAEAGFLVFAAEFAVPQ